MTGLAQVLALEDTLGVSAGHDTTVEFIERGHRPAGGSLGRRATDSGRRQPG